MRLSASPSARTSATRPPLLTSIVMPAYNCGRFIGAAIDSVLAQTSGEWELIVVDDGSTDDTPEIASSRARGDARIRVVACRHSGRPAVSRNVGIARAAGDLVAFLDGDDLLAPDRIATVGAIFTEKPDLDFLFHDMRLIDERGRAEPHTSAERYDYLRQASAHLVEIAPALYACTGTFYGFMSTETTGTYTSAVTVRRGALSREPEWFPEDLILWEDSDLWFRLVRNGASAFLNVPLGSYRRYGTSISSQREQFFLDQYAAHRRNFARAASRLTFAQRRRYRRQLAEMLGDIGYRHSVSGKSHHARVAYARSLGIWPQSYVVSGLAKTFVPGAVMHWFRARRAASEMRRTPDGVSL